MQLQGGDRDGAGRDHRARRQRRPPTRRRKKQSYQGKVQVQGDLGAADGAPVTIKVVVQERARRAHGADRRGQAERRRRGRGAGHRPRARRARSRRSRSRPGSSEGSYIEIKKGSERATRSSSSRSTRARAVDRRRRRREPRRCSSSTSVSRVYGEEVQGLRAARGVAADPRGRPHGDHRPVGFGEVDDARAARRARPARPRARSAIAGQDVTARSTTPPGRGCAATRIGFVFQQFHLIPHLTAFGNVDTALLYRGLTAAERRERAMAALEQVGLGRRADHRPVQMSGGEQQRVAIARAIVTEPLMVLADEPTGALDTTNAARWSWRSSPGLESPERAVVLVTHDLGVAATANRVVSMRDGEIVGDASQAPSAVRGDRNEPLAGALRRRRQRHQRRARSARCSSCSGPVVGVAAMVGRGRAHRVGQGRPQGEARRARHQPDHGARRAASFGQQNPTLPDDAVHRVQAVPTRASGRRRSARSTACWPCRTPGSEDYYQAFPVPVLAADDTLPERARGADAERPVAATRRPSQPSRARS